MKVFAIVAALLATPVAAFDGMTAKDCTDSWKALFDITRMPFSDVPVARNARVAVSPDGWCRVDGRQSALGNADFAVLDFQLDGAVAFIAGDSMPMGMDLQVEGLRIDGARSYDIFLSLYREPQTGLLHIERFSSKAADGSGVVASGVLQGAFFDSIASAQTSLAGIQLSELDAIFQINPAYLSDLDIDFGPVTPATVRNALRDVSTSQVSTASRDDFMAFAKAAPGATGELSVSIRSERGFGLIQIGMAGSHFSDAPDDNDIAKGMELMLSGMRVDVSWQPGQF